MNRRTFLQTTTAALAAAPFTSLLAQGIPPAVLRRIGITTVCFRENFPASLKLYGVKGKGGDMTLLTAPKFLADNLGLHNVEVWNAQFSETTLDYCKKVKAAANAVGSKIINIQIDLPNDNLSDPDPAKRADTLKTLKEWIDRAQAIGATSVRANTGAGPANGWDVKRTADGFRQLAAYGKPKGVMVLIENHIGYSADIDKVVQLVKEVNDPNCKCICDWGNSPANGTVQDKINALSKLFPYTHLCSAKKLDFDDNNKHTSYDIVPIVKAMEAAGFKGVYSIEFFTENKPPKDVVAAAKDTIKEIAANIKA